METLVEHELTLWFEDDVPARMVFAGTRWLVSDMPTRLRESVWSAALGKRGSGDGAHRNSPELLTEDPQVAWSG